MDMPDGTLVQETDSITDHYEPEEPDPPPPLVDQGQKPVDSKQLLREQLKRSLSNRVPPPGALLSAILFCPYEPWR